MKFRKTSKHTSYRRRGSALSLRDIFEIERIKKKLLLLIICNFLPSMIRILLLNNLYQEYQRIIYDGSVVPRPIAIKHLTFESFPEGDLRHLFRFQTYNDLKAVYYGLQMPDVVILDNNVRLSGVEVFLCSLRRLVFPNRFIDRAIEFGGDISLWSRAFKWFVLHVHETFALYGDSAYVTSSPAIVKRHDAEMPLTFAEAEENRCMSSVRVTIEWINKDFKTRFAFVNYYQDLKVRLCDYTDSVIFTAILLTNFHTCIYGSQTAIYFQEFPPLLDDYLQLNK